MPKFKFEPVYLSPEHARQVERFTGCPYDAEEHARMRAWAAYKHWDHKLRVRCRLIDTLHAVLQARQQTPAPGAERPQRTTADSCHRDAGDAPLLASGSCNASTPGRADPQS